jgi:NlpC/P60 family putative phage cell wall peptidase
MKEQLALRRASVLHEARKWLGTPYQHQASLCQIGCDCLGLVRGVWQALYGSEPVAIPAYTPYWAETGSAETLQDAARRFLVEMPFAEAVPGDVLLFRFSARHVAKHCAILSAPERIIHAYWGKNVSETSLTPWWRKRVSGAFQFPQ